MVGGRSLLEIMISGIGVMRTSRASQGGLGARHQGVFATGRGQENPHWLLAAVRLVGAWRRPSGALRI